MTPQLYLASRSPRRQALLAQVGLRFELLPAEVLERPAGGEAPEDYALRIATAKATVAAHAATLPLPVLAADTDVVLDGEILGKPRGEEDAVAMLLRLSGHVHKVYTAVAVVQGDRVETALSATRVAFGPVSEAQAVSYWRSGEPADKAGGYAIQGFGGAFVKEIWGSYTGVVGLPLYETCQLLLKFGVHAVPSPYPLPHPSLKGGGKDLEKK